MVCVESDHAPLVVIGYGNELRRDDGAGVVFARAITETWTKMGQPVHLLTEMQLLPEMAAALANGEVRAVVFVDAAVPSDANGIKITRLDLDSPSASLGHQVTPETLLVYAALLYGRYPQAWQVTIPGVDFDHGEGLSPEVLHLLDEVDHVAATLLADIKEEVPCMNLLLPSE
jgi:hydrogenase maturation protease